MRITVNGKPREVDGAGDIAALLTAFEINPKLVAVAINGDVVPRDTYADTPVRDGDEVEIVRMVGGGAA